MAHRRGQRMLMAALAATTLGLSGAVLAADFKSIGEQPAILYDAPTLRGNKLSVAPRGMPVEIVVVQGDWDRVRDSSGEFSWVEKRSIGERRTLVTLADVTVHAAGDDHSPALLRLAPGVLLDLVEPPSNGYAHIRHRDGVSGWVRVSEVWGL